MTRSWTRSLTRETEGTDTSVVGSNRKRAAAVVAIFLVAACGPGGRHVAQAPWSFGAASSPQAVSAEGAPVIIDSGVGEVFLPVTGVVPPMAAAAVWRKFALRDASSNGLVPPGTSVQLGTLTLPLGPGKPGEFRANAQLVWSFSWQQCAPVTSSVTPSQPPPCTAGAFFDASTGDLVDHTFHN